MARSLAVAVVLAPVVMFLAFVGGIGLGAGALKDSTSDEPPNVGIPCATSITGQLTLAQANIPTRSGMSGFRASMPRVLSHHPDFVTLDEQNARTLKQIEAAAPGYTAYRINSLLPTPGTGQARDEVVLYKQTWRRLAGGRIQLVARDHTVYDGHPVVWWRYAVWATLQRPSDGAVVSVISVHQMTNPAKYGPDKPRRQRQYAAGMDLLLGLVARLEDYGPVFVGGDFNVHASQISSPWTAPAKMRAAGYGWYTADVDYLFYPSAAGGVRLVRGWSGPIVSDHPWISATFDVTTVAGATAGCPSAGPSPGP